MPYVNELIENEAYIQCGANLFSFPNLIKGGLSGIEV